jgi:hypothetical protein
VAKWRRAFYDVSMIDFVSCGLVEALSALFDVLEAVAGQSEEPVSAFRYGVEPGGADAVTQVSTPPGRC